MPLKKTGVYLEAEVVFAEFIPKFKGKTAFFNLFLE